MLFNQKSQKIIKRVMVVVGLLVAISMVFSYLFIPF